MIDTRNAKKVMRAVSLILTVFMILTLAACGRNQAEPEIRDWTRQGYFSDKEDNMLSVTWMEDIADPGWYVGVMIGDFSGGCTLPQEGNTLHGNLNGWDESAEPYVVTVSEEGEDGLLLTVEGGETYSFKPADLPEATIIVHINTEGEGNIAYAEGEEAPEIDPEYPFQSAQINLAEPVVHTLEAWPKVGNLFVKWMKNGEDFSTEPLITVLLDESADYTAVFEEDADWQNPVMNFVGEYQCDQAHATVECFGREEAKITVEWGGNAGELTRWDITGFLDPDTLTIRYSGSMKLIITYDENGEIKNQEPVYGDGTGTILFDIENNTFTWHEDLSETGNDMVFQWIGSLDNGFSYVHDPRENPDAMADIIENPDAVYGFSPDPASKRLGSYAEYDWTDPAFVAKAQEERRAYHESMDSMTDILEQMREKGASIEEMARAVSEERNRLRLASYQDDPEGLAEVKESNLKTYGHEEGPTPDELFEKYGSWTEVLQKAFSSNMGMDACCGLYDEYYWLYIELGYVE